MALLALLLALAALGSAGRTSAHVDPTDCDPSIDIDIFALRDLVGGDGIGDTVITLPGPVSQGETIYYLSALNADGCAFEGGAIEIDPPGATGATDVTPAGGIPCIGGTTDDVDATGDDCEGSPASIDSEQLPYDVDCDDVATSGLLEAFADYSGGITHASAGDTLPASASISHGLECEAASLTLIKVDTDGNPQEGVLLEVTGPSPETTTFDCTTDATGECTITGLAPGSYDVSEPTPPDGFTLVGCEPDPVEVTVEGPNEVTCTNEPETADLTLIKVDTEGNPMEGILLEVTGPSPETTTFDCTTDATGECTIVDLVPGSYDVSEPDPGDGFAFVGCEPDPVEVTVEGPNEVTCTNEPVGEEGCTPGFWKQDQHFDSWTAPYEPTDLVSSVFTLPGALTDGTGVNFGTYTLLDALQGGGGAGVDGATKILLRAAVASLLNAASPDIDFTMSTADVISDVNDALASLDRDEMLDLAGDLDADNNLGCPLN